ncbi:ABC transporter permease [bacterium 0.1xD8-71]|nr:ABC transporter permease [bacterium 0.1xD8-71]
MEAFLYGVSLQWKLDIRSRTLLTTCYIVLLLFFAVMGGVFTSVMPGVEQTLIQSMTVFGVTMGALIGLPPSLVEIYGSDIKKVYKANGVPLYLVLVLTTISALIHLFIMSIIIYILAPLLFDAVIPENPVVYFSGLLVFILVSLGMACVIGLGVKEQAKTPMFSILIFLPSTVLSGIMFPVERLPKVLRTAGSIFPTSWGYRLMTQGEVAMVNLWPLLLMFLISVMVCIILLQKVSRR